MRISIIRGNVSGFFCGLAVQILYVHYTICCFILLLYLCAYINAAILFLLPRRAIARRRSAEQTSNLSIVRALAKTKYQTRWIIFPTASEVRCYRMLPSTQELRPSPTALWGHWLNHCLLSAPAFRVMFVVLHYPLGTVRQQLSQDHVLQER